MNTVVTLIAPNPIPNEFITTVSAALDGSPYWLTKEVSADIQTDLDPKSAEQKTRALIDGKKIDVAAQPIAGRRKKLLVADMESTIIENEMLDELAEELGLREEIAAITTRAMRGELNFETAIRERVARLANLSEESLSKAERKIRITPGAMDLVATMKANGAYCALVSSGFDYYTRRIRKRLGFDIDQANRLELRDGRLTGTIVPPILGRNAKKAALESLSAKCGISVEDAIAVGDGANDLEMLTTAGTGVAFKAKPVVAEATQFRIDYGDLRALLYIQGYTEREICEVKQL